MNVVDVKYKDITWKTQDLNDGLCRNICDNHKMFICICNDYNLSISLFLKFIIDDNSFNKFQIDRFFPEYAMNYNQLNIYNSVGSMLNFDYFKTCTNINQITFISYLRLKIAYKYYCQREEFYSFELLLQDAFIKHVNCSTNPVILHFDNIIKIQFDFIYYFNDKINNNTQKPNFWKRLFHKEKPDKEFRLVVNNYSPKINIEF